MTNSFAKPSNQRPPTAVAHQERSIVVGRWAIVVILGAFGLRAWHLGAQSLWWDEAFSLDLAGQSLGAIIRGDIHPPLYHLMLAGWVRLAGTTEFAARYLSVLGGTLLVALAYRVARRLLDAPSALLAALLVAGSPALLWYSQEARMYILVALIYLTLIWLFHRLTDPATRPAPTRLWLALAAVEVAGLYTHYFIALGIAWLVIAVLVRQRGSRFAPHGRLWRPLLVSQIAVAVAYLPWIPIFVSLQSRFSPPSATVPSLRTFYDQVWHGYNAGSLALVGHHAPFMALSTVVGILFAILLAFALLRDPRRRGPLWLMAHTLVPLAAVFTLMQFRPFFHPRYVVMLAPPLLILLGWTITSQTLHGSRLLPRVAGLGLLLVTAATFTTAIHAFATEPRFQRDDLRGLARHLAAVASADDAVVFGYFDYPFRYYYTGSAPALYLDLSRRDAVVAQALAAGLQDRRRAILVTWGQAPVDSRGLLRWLLASAGRLVEVQPHGDLTSQTYALDRPVSTPTLSGQGADFGELRLVGAGVPATLPAAGAVPVAMAWAAPAQPPADYKVALRLLDAGGHVVSRSDILLVDRAGEPTAKWAAGSRVASYTTLPLPRGTTPGTYAVDLVVYESAGMSVLERRDRPGQRVDLGALRLTASGAPFLSAPLPGFTPVEATLGGLVLEGFAADRREVGPGGRLSVALRWRVTGAPPQHVPALRLVSGGKVVAEEGGPLYPASMGGQDQVILDWRDVVVLPDAPAGTALLQVVAGDADHTLAEIALLDVERRFDLPAMRYSFQARFGTVAELLGYDLETTARAGAPVELTLYWRALGSSAIDYTVFTHLLSGEGRVVGQHDGGPDGGRRPTTGWLQGEIIVDRHLMTFRQAGYTGVARVEVGLYDQATDRRLTTPEGADHVVLPATVEVSP